MSELNQNDDQEKFEYLYNLEETAQNLGAGAFG